MNGFSAITLVAEEKILEAQRQGAFEFLPGAGDPLPPDESLHLPPEQRMAYTLLKNSGYLVPGNGSHPETVPLPRLKEGEGTRSRFVRLALALSRRKRARGEAADPALELGLSRAMEDSPYLEKMLKKF